MSFPLLQRSAPDIKAEFFELLHQILLNNWRYFFRSNIQTRVTTGEDGMCENQGQFAKMMEVGSSGSASFPCGRCRSLCCAISYFICLYISQAFGQTFTQTDIAVFKQNLESLEDLNSKCKLYQKVHSTGPHCMKNILP